MKINIFSPNGLNPYKRQQNKLDSVQSGQNKKNDQVQISSAAKEMLEGTPAQLERQYKIEKLKVDIETGNYTVDAKQVAHSMINFYNKK